MRIITWVLVRLYLGRLLVNMLGLKKLICVVATVVTPVLLNAEERSYLNPPNDLCPDELEFDKSAQRFVNEVSRATRIFVGHVISMEFLDPRPTKESFNNIEPRIIVTLKVTIPLKETSTGDNVTLYTRWNGWSFTNAAKISSCSGFVFEEGQEYLVFAYPHTKYSFSSDFKNLPKSALDTSRWAGTRSTKHQGFSEDLEMIRALLE